MTEKRLREIIREEIKAMREEAVIEYSEGGVSKFQRIVEKYGNGGVSRKDLLRIHNYKRSDIDRALKSGDYVELKVLTGKVSPTGKESVERRIFVRKSE